MASSGTTAAIVWEHVTGGCATPLIRIVRLYPVATTLLEGVMTKVDE
jgi:hypothetical protein